MNTHKTLTVGRPEWYTNITMKKNRSWTASEKKKVYHMRVMKNKGVDDIVVAFNGTVTKTQVYNVIRMMKKAAKNRCFKCGDLLKNGYQTNKPQLCHKCSSKTQEYKNQLRQNAIKEGLCAVCHKKKAIPGYKTCKYCLSATYRRRIANGICGSCGKRPISGKSISQCATCLKAQSHG